MPQKGNANTGRARGNSRSMGSAAAHAGIIGLPDCGRGPNFGDGGLIQFCRTFSQRFDRMAETCRPEWRSFSQAERELRG